MKTKYSFCNFLKKTTSLMLMSIPMLSFAKEINLFEQPKANAKVVSTIDPATGIIPIYQPKESGWTKVADPRNGNVGWMKSSDFSESDGTRFYFSQSVVKNNKTPTTYRIIQFGQPKPLSSQETQTMIKKMEAHQIAMQKSMHNMIISMNQIFADNWHLMHDGFFPTITPVVTSPLQKNGIANGVEKKPDLTNSSSTNSLNKSTKS